jgi:hypothetical protein
MKARLVSSVMGRPTSVNNLMKPLKRNILLLYSDNENLT